MTHSLRSTAPGYRSRECGGTALTFALLLIPIMLLVGTAIDFARMLEFKSVLQASVDEAALAGAAVFTDKTQDKTAVRVATEYFDNARLPPKISISRPTVTADVNGTINPDLSYVSLPPHTASPYLLAGSRHAHAPSRHAHAGSPYRRVSMPMPGTAPAYTVTVTATAKVATTLMSLILPSESITATATAGQPVITADPYFSHVNWWACDGNTAYMYRVPPAANGAGYDYSKVPAFTVANGSTQGNYYEIGTSYPSTSPLGKLPAGQEMPSVSVNQPLGIMLRNDTNGNTSTCGAPVTGANSYGAPNLGSQAFYSSLLENGQSPSQYSNYNYTVTVQSNAGGIAKVTTTLPPSLRYPNGKTIDEPIAPGIYNNLATYLGVNDPASGHSNCSTSTSKSGAYTYKTYRCRTQYFTTQTSSKSNCLLYVQTGVTSDYIWNLTGMSSAPEAALGNCFSPTGGGAKYAAPTCAQLSALASDSGGGGVTPAAVFWWDDGGGVTSREQFYLPRGHCSAASPGGAGYGEDCLYKNNLFVVLCSMEGGSGSGYTEVVLTK